MKLTRDDFEAWRCNPLSELILDAMLQYEMDATKGQHDREAWHEPLSPEKHAVYRERYETLEWLKTLSFEDVKKWLEDQTDGEVVE